MMMGVYVALLRAVNVGGTTTLLMKQLCAICERAGFEGVKTYIQSGNVVFTSRLSEAKVQAKLGQALQKELGKPVQVLVRTGAELESIIKRNPFKQAAANRIAVYFLDSAPAKNALKDVIIPAREELKLSGRELFVHYPDGMGRSKLKVPFLESATARNLNTVTKLAAMAEAID